ncbi:MAG TPA: TolC family protein, partial [Longimicrobiaceae bacterium]|nr:TolC family protein [Longimicrobiaceae bacterium]
RPCRIPIVLAAAGLTLCAGPLRAQAPRADSLSLLDAVRIALGSSPNVELARRDVSASEGGVLVASSAFHPQLATSLGSTRAMDVAGDSAAAANILTRTTVYSAKVQQRTRWGVAVTPEISAERLDGSKYGAGAANSATAGVNFLVPLMRGRGRIAGADERAAQSSYRASVHGLQHTTAQVALDAVEAYWNYVAATRQLAVLTESEQRARRLVEETRILVNAEERPPADLNQLQANLAYKSATRIEGEQSLVEAQHRLGIALGLPLDRIVALPPPATDFPSARGTEMRIDPVPLVVAALANRGDLAAAAEQRTAAQQQLAGARDALHSRFDLSVDVGYTGAQRGDAVGRLFTPFYGNLAGWTAAVQVGYAPGALDGAARGVAQQTRAAYEQREVNAAELRRQVSSAVVVATQALAHSRAELEMSDQAAGLYRTALESEKQKFGLGMSTLFDVLQAEDGLTNALVQQINARFRYAQAVAQLRFETGTLVDFAGAEPTAGLAALTTVPTAAAAAHQ